MMVAHRIETNKKESILYYTMYNASLQPVDNNAHDLMQHALSQERINCLYYNSQEMNIDYASEQFQQLLQNTGSANTNLERYWYDCKDLACVITHNRLQKAIKRQLLISNRD